MINVASGSPVMIKEVVDKIVFYVGAGIPKFGALKYRKNENMKLFADISKARAILGWQPKVDLDTGLMRMINRLSE